MVPAYSGQVVREQRREPLGAQLWGEFCLFTEVLRRPRTSL